MFYRIWRRCWLAMPVLLTVLCSAMGVYARPATVFMPYIELIQSNLPLGLAMRLPTDIPLSGPSDIEEDKLVVRVFPAGTPKSFTVSIFTCESSPQPCLLGSFSVQANTNPSAKLDLVRHQATGFSIPLTKNVQGYLLEGPRQNPSYQFSTLMWQQGGMIYTISFLAIERDNIVSMAASMALEQPLYHLTSRPVISPQAWK